MSKMTLNVADLKSATLEPELGKLVDAQLPGPGTPPDRMPSPETLDALRAMGAQAVSLAKMHALSGPGEITFEETAAGGGMLSIRHGADVVTTQNLDPAEVAKAAAARKALARKIVAPAPAGAKAPSMAGKPAIASSAKPAGAVASVSKSAATALRR